MARESKSARLLANLASPEPGRPVTAALRQIGNDTRGSKSGAWPGFVHLQRAFGLFAA
jgi:hypothetical protein